MGMSINGMDAVVAEFAGRAGEVEDRAKKAVRAGAKHVQEALRQRLSTQNVSGRSTHQLEKSLKVDPVKYDAGRGYYAKVHPDGYDTRGQPLPLIANVLEYGRSGGKGQYPWLQPTVETEEGAVQQILKDTFIK